MENQTWNRLDTLLQDLRYSFRTLRRDAGFATFAILIVGLGIGASSTLFSVVDTVLLRPLPFRDPQRLVWMANHDVSGLSGQTTQVGTLLDLREQNRSFADVAGYFAFYGVGDNVLTGHGTPERLSSVPVSCNFFPVLGVEPEVGRQFTAEECKWHGSKAVLLSHGFWERRFASDRGIVGRTVTLDNEPVLVAGVLPVSFDFATVFAPGSHIDLFAPFPLSPETNRWGNTMAIVGRLKPGVSIGSAQAEVKILAGHIISAHPERNDFEGKLSPLAVHVSGQMRPALLVLAGAVGVVMLIVCANLSNLLLARTAARQKEIAIRTALGAGQWRLIRQMLTEGVTLSGAGALLGILLALGGTRALAHLDAINIPLLQNVRIDGAALGFALLMAVLTGIVFGLAPALHIPTALHDVLKDTNRGSTEGRRRGWVRSALVVSEIAFACVLLVGAGLLIRSFLRVLDVNLGFHPERTASIRVDPDFQLHSQEEANDYFDEVLRRARSVPGVVGAGLTDALPLGRNRTWGVGVKGRTFPQGKNPSAFVRVVSDGYITTMGILIRQGRDLTERDGASNERVMLINETMARTLFPGEDAIGKFIQTGKDWRVVGVVGDVHHLALEQGAGSEMYLPIRQIGKDWASLDLVMRTTLPPAQFAAAIRAALKPIAPNLPGNDFRPLQQLVDKAVSPRRFVVLLLGGFAVFALILASLGIYGVISYSVNQRTQEIGIRMALGASAGNLQARIILQTLGLAAAGMALGTAASWALARALSGLLFQTTAADPVTFLGMLVVLGSVSAIAGYLPARRASRIDPSIALRAN